MAEVSLRNIACWARSSASSLSRFSVSHFSRSAAIACFSFSSSSRHPSALAAVHAAHVNAQVKVEKAHEERDEAKDSEEMATMMVGPLEQMRREMKTVLLATRSAMLEAGLPSKQKTDAHVPTYFQTNSWTSRQQTPWNDAAKRAMTPAEGIQWLATKNAQLEAENKQLKEAAKE